LEGSGSISWDREGIPILPQRDVDAGGRAQEREEQRLSMEEVEQGHTPEFHSPPNRGHLSGAMWWGSSRRPKRSYAVWEPCWRRSMRSGW
jgi:hypothetical protein